MFIGHYGPAVWDTQRGKETPLVTLWQGFLAVQFIDIIWAVLTIFGIEGPSVAADGTPVFHIPWSHSLLTSLILAGFAGLMFRFFKPSAGSRGFWVIAGLVFSHWILDLIVHRPDLPLYPGGSLMLGFGFWNFPIAAYVLEMGLVFSGFLFWQRVTSAKSKRYDYALWAFFIVMAALQAYVILIPGLALQAGNFDASVGPRGPALGVTTLIIFFGMASIISWIEKGRPSKFSPQNLG
ncbi:hypothetical protein [Hellea balneolensis]|uniref:hypothetical protein n=1 Tax=Hellea balneolensis TaxID=287478 RepID=UPI00042666DB|nr:hypothetical protein [Hellea balneolensis]